MRWNIICLTRSLFLFLLYRGVRGDKVCLISNYILPTLENPSSMNSLRNTKTIIKKRNSLEVNGVSTSAEVDSGRRPENPRAFEKARPKLSRKLHPRGMPLPLCFRNADFGSGHCPPPPSWDRFNFQLQKRRYCPRGLPRQWSFDLCGGRKGRCPLTLQTFEKV